MTSMTLGKPGTDARQSQGGQIASDDPERITVLTRALQEAAHDKIGRIKQVTAQTRILALNATIEAARAGESGRGFAVVAGEVKGVSDRISGLADELDRDLAGQIRELDGLGQRIVEAMKGSRLVDLAYNAIEIIDRNLYERTADVRWWATDSAVVAALEDPGEATSRHASRKLGVILGAYTVYLDLWICDRHGRVVASGRPDRYPHVRAVSMASEPWFQEALRHRSGDEYGTGGVRKVAALDDAPSAIYAAAIRRSGDAHGETLGVLVIHFDWKTQADTVVQGVRLMDAERGRTRTLIVDSGHTVLAASDGSGTFTERVCLPGAEPTGFRFGNDGTITAWARTPGYETYPGQGWTAVIQQARAG